jgi:hypothetical protein
LEVKEKKRQAYLNKARTGAKGGSKSRKGMSTPYDYMNKAEKAKLNGEVETYNMNTTILKIDEFRLKDEALQKTLLTGWRELYDNTHIRKELGVSNKVFYDLVNELKIPRKARVDTPGKRTSKPKQAKPKIEAMPQGSLLELTERKMNSIEKHIEKLNRILTKCQLLMEDEPHKFQLKISLSEIIGK